MNSPGHKIQLQSCRAEVQRQFGDCLLRLQGYERLLKAVLAAHQTVARIDEDGTAKVAPSMDVNRNTLGTLVGTLLDSILTDGGPASVPIADDEVSSARFQFSIGLRPEDFAQIETDLRELVRLRNDLVHHFLDTHDLASLKGCEAALGTLSAASVKINDALDALRTWAHDMDNGKQEMATFLASETMQHFVQHGRFPWPNTAIVQALEQAEAALSQNGWTAVKAATEWMNAHHPDERPENYGCGSWRQIIHEAGLFELQYQDTHGAREAWFRRKPE